MTIFQAFQIFVIFGQKMKISNSVSLAKTYWVTLYIWEKEKPAFFRPNMNKLCHLHWHSWNLLAPRLQVAVSSGHFWQLRDLVWGWKYPTRHVVQGAKPSREKLPGPQNSTRNEEKKKTRLKTFSPLSASNSFQFRPDFQCE